MVPAEEVLARIEGLSSSALTPGLFRQRLEQFRSAGDAAGERAFLDRICTSMWDTRHCAAAAGDTTAREAIAQLMALGQRRPEVTGESPIHQRPRSACRMACRTRSHYEPGRHAAKL